MGPSRSQQSSTQIINGNVTSTSSITFTYILMADKEGTYTIPGATIVADGENKTSNSVQIKVLPPDQTDGSSSNGGSSGRTSSRNQVAGSKITNQDLFITATATKTTVYEQEAILLTYKVYTLVNLTELYGDMPKLTNIYTQEVELPQKKTFTLEHYNGRNYNTTVWRQYVLFPQQVGKIEIPAITFEGTVAQQVASDDPFDAFFNGGSNYVQIKKNIISPKLVFNVNALPSGKPANFSGGVGDFSISSSISTKELKTNDAVTVKVIISGTGNLKLINTPEINFPKDFEVYDPKVDNNFNLTREGLSGNKVIEYLAIPRHAGNFTIPPIEFSYFDLKTKSYKTIKTEAYELKVEKGEGNADQVIADFTNKEDLKVLGHDIRYIKLGDTKLTRKDDFFFGSMSYYLWYIIPLVLFIVFVIVCRKQAIENANVAKVRTKKANKVATKRMKNASKLLAGNQKEAFYDEVLKALWGYISDKLSIPVSQLSKDNIEEELTKYGVNPELIKDFIGTLNECEFARYAPGNQNEAMDKVYASAVEVISKMENSIKH
ncbi:MAG: BatD family protein, partial [Bacteroidales bacterium]|nr:BatD family protein [Bacteroidales bacterium]